MRQRVLATANLQIAARCQKIVTVSRYEGSASSSDGGTRADREREDCRSPSPCPYLFRLSGAGHGPRPYSGTCATPSCSQSAVGHKRVKVTLRLRLLAAAWSPALLLIAIRLSDGHIVWTIVTSLAGSVAVASVLTLLRARSATNEQPFQLTMLQDESSQVPGYLLTFVFPFVFVDVSSWREGATWGLFAILTFFLVLSTDLVLVNPVLLAVGYRLYRIQTSSGFEGLLLSRRRPMQGQTVEAVRLSGEALKLTSIQA